MSNPDTLLAAAKATAVATEIEWSHVQKYYRALQESKGDASAYLPRSKGRQFWVAHPNFISRLLVAMAVVESHENSVSAVDWSFALQVDPETVDHPLGISTGVLNPLEAQMAAFLVSPDRADDLDKVIFQRDCNKVVFCLKNGDELSYSADTTPSENSHLSTQKIQRRGVLSGEIFQRLARMIVWKNASDKPVKSVSTSSDPSG